MSHLAAVVQQVLSEFLKALWLPRTKMKIHCGCVALVFLTLSCLTAESWRPLTYTSELPPEAMHSSQGDNKPSGDEHHHGKRWAVLVAGSRGYDNYRHQADVCHAYQLLKKGGLRDENIIVFMYDDIAFDESNPRPGVIINKPNGDDVYEGVPKDYIGDDVTANNFYAVILGNKSALTGGSGKVVDSGPKDYIFIYYADHGSVGVIGMPNGDYVYAKDLVEVLKKKNDARSFRSMVFYLEACESGTMFEGLLPNTSNIYATTAANAEESSWATYCPRDDGGPLEEYGTCLGDLYSVSWMEDSDKHDLRKETLGKQYEVVRRRTAADNLDSGSHVMQYGNTKRRNDFLVSYMGTNPDNDNFTVAEYLSSPSSSGVVAQRDAGLLHFWHKYKKAPAGSHYKLEAEKRLLDEISYRKHVDYSINHIATLLFGSSKSSEVLGTVRPTGQPVVDDWDCFKMLVRTYEKYCGSLTKSGMKYMKALANMCNAGVTMEQMAAASIQTCSGIPPT